MKHIITLFAILVATATGVYAQTDSLVIFDTKGDNLGISIAGFNIAIGGNDREEYTDEYIYHELMVDVLVSVFFSVISSNSDVESGNRDTEIVSFCVEDHKGIGLCVYSCRCSDQYGE